MANSVRGTARTRITLLAVGFWAGGLSGCALAAPQTQMAGRWSPPSDPSPDDIIAEADRADEYLSRRVADGNTKRAQLHSKAEVGRWIARLGQLVGGSGALLFGLNDNGRNAAWAGAVGAGFSFFDDVMRAGTNEKAAENCATLATMEPQVKKNTAVWRLNKGNADFRATFGKEGGPFMAFYDLVDAAYRLCFR